MQDYREDGIKVGQTTKGIWYVVEIAIHTDKLEDALKQVDNAMGKANRMLGVRNRYAYKKSQTKKEWSRI